MFKVSVQKQTHGELALPDIKTYHKDTTRTQHGIAKRTHISTVQNTLHLLLVLGEIVYYTVSYK